MAQQVVMIADRFNTRIRPLRNGDKIRIEAEVPYSEEAWLLIAPLATKRITLSMSEATQQELDELEGQEQLEGIEEE